jgi:DNA-binding NtrC family response regulator
MRLLLIGTEDGLITSAGRIAHQRGAQVAQVSTVEEGLVALRSGIGADLVLIDGRMAVAELTASLKSERMAIPVVACGLSNDSESAVRAIKAGAKEYLPLPPDAELIAAILAAAATIEEQTVVFRDPKMLEVMRLAERVGASDASMLITGESGTGKEVMARFVHEHSKRAGRKFVALNCAALPENLLESELFGHEKGAFTGAIARRIGKFEEANGGTLLLDEISEMDVRLQAKLLRAIQERVIERLGGNELVKVDIRIIATSNRDLPEECKKGTFREDLYFRLNVFNLQLPPLRERPQDVAALAAHFIKKYAEVNGLAVAHLSAAALDRLQNYSWRGNVRELENTIHRAVLLAVGDTVEVTDIVLADGGSLAKSIDLSQDLASVVAKASTDVTVDDGEVAESFDNAAILVGRTVAEVERQLILDTLDHTLGNRTHAANILGISIRTLRNKLRQYSDEGFAVSPAALADLEADAEGAVLSA